MTGRSDELSPFGVRVQDVANLATDVPILDAAPTSARPFTTTTILVDTVAGWIADASQLLRSRLLSLYYRRSSGLTDDALDLLPPQHREYVDLACRSLVILDVAAQTIDAAYPTAAANEYATILRGRYETNLTALLTRLDAWDVGAETGEADRLVGGAAAVFPLAAVPDMPVW